MLFLLNLYCCILLWMFVYRVARCCYSVHVCVDYFAIGFACGFTLRAIFYVIRLMSLLCILHDLFHVLMLLRLASHELLFMQYIMFLLMIIDRSYAQSVF